MGVTAAGMKRRGAIKRFGRSQTVRFQQLPEWWVQETSGWLSLGKERMMGGDEFDPGHVDLKFPTGDRSRVQLTAGNVVGREDAAKIRIWESARER